MEFFGRSKNLLQGFGLGFSNAAHQSFTRETVNSWGSQLCGGCFHSPGFSSDGVN
jgi:hypothetical protein